MVLDRIKKVNDIKQLNEEELEELQEEIRDFLVENMQKPEDIWHRIWV
jgi:1-deoxy-D-xylulose-5-phosphate synthase